MMSNCTTADSLLFVVGGLCLVPLRNIPVPGVCMYIMHDVNSGVSFTELGSMD